MLHLTPATLQGHTVGEGIKDLFLSIPFFLFFSFFFFLKGKKGKAGLMETENWWTCLQATLDVSVFKSIKKTQSCP